VSRDDGFPTADIDTGLLDDPKIRRLIRACADDEGLIARCLIAYQAVLYASWGRGERVTLDDAAPLWLTGLDDLAARLVEHGLLASDRRVASQSWDNWFGPAWDRREERRASGRKGGQAKARNKHLSGLGVAEVEQSQSEALPVSTVLPSLPSDTSREPARGGHRMNGRDHETCVCGDRLSLGDKNVRQDRWGQLWHVECPPELPSPSPTGAFDDLTL